MKNGFRIIDSDMHIVEPAQLWEKYIDERFKDRAPRVVGNYLTGPYGLMEDRMLPTVDAHARELPVSDETKRRILWDNCARLYGL